MARIAKYLDAPTPQYKRLAACQGGIASSGSKMGPVAESVWGAERLDTPYVLTGHGGLEGFCFFPLRWGSDSVLQASYELCFSLNRFFFTAARIRLLTSSGLCFVREPRSKNIEDSKNLYWPPQHDATHQTMLYVWVGWRRKR